MSSVIHILSPDVHNESGAVSIIPSNSSEMDFYEISFLAPPRAMPWNGTFICWHPRISSNSRWDSLIQHSPTFRWRREPYLSPSTTECLERSAEYFPQRCKSAGTSP